MSTITDTSTCFDLVSVWLPCCVCRRLSTCGAERAYRPGAASTPAVMSAGRRRTPLTSSAHASSMTWSRSQRLQLSGIVAVICLLHVVGWTLYLSLTSGPLGAGAFAGAGVLAYVLGIRHAFDADHIAAIDDTTRLMVQRGRRPVGVGFFFAMGHSSVVVDPRPGRRAGGGARELEQHRGLPRGRRHRVHRRRDGVPRAGRGAQRDGAGRDRRLLAPVAPRSARRGRAGTSAAQPRPRQPHPRRPRPDAHQTFVAHVPARPAVRARSGDRLRGHAARPCRPRPPRARAAARARLHCWPR